MYNIPTQLSSSQIRNYLLADERFENRQSNDTINSAFFEATYWGRILRIELPNSSKVDSSSIELTFGLGTVSVFNEKTKTYSGRYKILNFEYFFSDSMEISKLFDWAKKDFEIGASKIDFTRYNSSTSYGDGVTITYINNRKKFRQIELFKTFYDNGTNGLLIKYQTNDK